MENTAPKLQKLLGKFSREKFKEMNEEMSFAEYVELLYTKPKLARNAFQMIYDMIITKGSKKFEQYRKELTHYNFFDQGSSPIYGLQETLDGIVNFIKGAAGGYGTEKRVLLLHGPVGSSKSTIARCLKRGLEKYSKTDEGAWYSYKWVDLPTGQDGIYTKAEKLSPMHEDPIKLLPPEVRRTLIEELNEVLSEQVSKERNGEDLDPQVYTLKCQEYDELNPLCRTFMNKLLKMYDGDWEKILTNHIRVVRMVYSEADRVGIATFQPKDEKNQDSTELTGDIDWSMLPHFGSDSDPRAFSFDGEFCIANRGMVEFIEMLKLQQEFLYDLLGATQENQIKPKKFAQIHINEFIIGHTNNPEYVKLTNNDSMEALRDRTVKVDVPYLLRLKDEVKVLEQDYGPGKVKQHIAPHTLEIAALWAILTRLKNDKDGNLTLVQKAKLYNGEILPGYTEDSVKELRDKYQDEGMFEGISARYVQDKISNCLSKRKDYISAFMVMTEIQEGLENSSLVTNKEDIAKYRSCVEWTIEEYNEILKNEVRKALVGDVKSIERLCANYIDNLMAYIKKTRIRNKITGRDESPNEKLMRSIETKIGITDQAVDDFRRMIAAFIGDLANQDKKFSWESNPDLKRALEAKLFDDVKDHIKLSALNVSEASTVQPDLQEKIDAIKKRLIDQYGYNEQSATDVLEHVGSIFARGNMADED